MLRERPSGPGVSPPASTPAVEMAVRTRDLVQDTTADGEPELVISSFSGGMHCCTTRHVF